MILSIDQLSGGLDADKDLVLPGQPDEAEMREGVSIWMYEENGAFGFPRMGVEAVGSSWDDRPFQANFALPGGRILDGGAIGRAPSQLGADGRPTVCGAGPLTFRCIEPFRRWTVSFDGTAADGHYSDQIHRRFDRANQIPVRLEAELTMVTPAWVQVMEGDDDRPEASFMGLGYRYEHLFRAKGEFTVDGQTRPFTGTGLRIHRQSIRRMEGFYGHCWQSAVFPDGRAFGLTVYPPKADGPQYNTGYIYQDGRMIDAKVVKAPWLQRLVGAGEDVTVELESELGRTTIAGETLFSTFHLGSKEMNACGLYQGGARYTWDGQTAVGMIERSSPEEQLSIG